MEVHVPVARMLDRQITDVHQDVLHYPAENKLVKQEGGPGGWVKKARRLEESLSVSFQPFLFHLEID